MVCERCGEDEPDISRAGWKRSAGLRETGKHSHDYFAHHGLCPRDIEAYWKGEVGAGRGVDSGSVAPALPPVEAHVG